MESAAAAGRSSLTALSHRLLKQFSAGGKGVSNLVFSPLSVYSALSVLAAGARGGTLNELLDVLSARCRKGLLENASEMVHRALAGGPRMVYACGMWHDAMRNLKPVYRGVAARFMGVHAPRRRLSHQGMYGRSCTVSGCLDARAGLANPFSLYN
jgi:serpin B